MPKLNDQSKIIFKMNAVARKPEPKQPIERLGELVNVIDKLHYYKMNYYDWVNLKNLVNEIKEENKQRFLNLVSIPVYTK